MKVLFAESSSANKISHIEGNELSRLEALRAVEHQLEADDRAKLELVNYVRALEFIAEAHSRNEIEYSPDFLKQLHGVLTKGLGRDDGRFKPHHEGEWRDGEVVVRDAMRIYHVGPDKDEVPDLMAARLTWLEKKRQNPEYPIAVLAGVAHFEVAEVHPFADYNGRAARLLATAVFFREGFLTRSLFSPEKYYADDKDAYFAALRAIKTTRHLERWLAYYVGGLAAEFERVAAKVKELAEVTRALPLPLQLTATQEHAIAMLTTGRRRYLTIAELSDATGISSRTASRDLNALVEAGVMRASGATRDRRFRLAATSTTGAGRPPTWTAERVERELRGFAEEVGEWPTYRDFRRLKRLALYAAMRRSGGTEYWRERIEAASAVEQ